MEWTKEELEGFLRSFGQFADYVGKLPDGKSSIIEIKILLMRLAVDLAPLTNHATRSLPNADYDAICDKVKRNLRDA